jgi:hypothetical protein
MIRPSPIDSTGTELIDELYGNRDDNAASWSFDVVLVAGLEDVRVFALDATPDAQIISRRSSPPGATGQVIDGFVESAADPILGKSEPPSEDTRQLAKQLAQTANEQDLFKTDAFLGIGGQIQIVVYHLRHYLELTIESDGSIDYFREYGGTEIEGCEQLTIGESLDIIRAFGKEVWTSSGSSAGANIITPWVDSKAPLL